MNSRENLDKQLAERNKVQAEKHAKEKRAALVVDEATFLANSFPISRRINQLEYLNSIPQAELEGIRTALVTLREQAKASNFSEKIISQLTDCIRNTSFSLQAENQDDSFRRLVKSIEYTFNDFQYALQPAFPLMDLPPDLRRYVILPFLSLNKDHTNFRRVHEESRKHSDEYWSVSFKVNFKEEYEQYYEAGSASINWHQEYTKWMRWYAGTKKAEEQNNTRSMAETLQTALLLEMPHRKLTQLLQSVKPNKVRHLINELITILSVNLSKPRQVVSFLNLSPILNTTREELAKALISAAVDMDEQWIRKLTFFLDPDCGLAQVVNHPGNIGFLFTALHWKRAEYTKMLLEHGCNPNLPQIENDIYKGEMPLYVALKRNDQKTAALLFLHGAKIEYDGRILLFDAINMGHVKMVELLFSFGADANKNNRHNVSPLYEAIRTGNTEIVNSLIVHGAKTDAECLKFAKSLNNPDIVKLVLIGIYKDYIKKTKLRDKEDQTTRIKLNLFGKQVVDIGLGPTAQEKIKRAKIYRDVLLFGREEDKKQARDNYRWEHGELGEISKEAVEFFK